MGIIGLTGGICAGKSGVTKILKAKGFPVIDCDKITDELYMFPWFTEGLENIFGKKILYNGQVNRGKLGNLVFSDYKEMRKLNNYCKPFIFQEVQRQLNDLILLGHEFIFIDAPILFESGLDLEIDFICSDHIISLLFIYNIGGIAPIIRKPFSTFFFNKVLFFILFSIT